MTCKLADNLSNGRNAATITMCVLFGNATKPQVFNHLGRVHRVWKNWVTLWPFCVFFIEKRFVASLYWLYFASSAMENEGIFPFGSWRTAIETEGGNWELQSPHQAAPGGDQEGSREGGPGEYLQSCFVFSLAPPWPPHLQTGVQFFALRLKREARSP